MFDDRDVRAEAESALPSGSAGATHEAEGVPGEGDPASQPGRCLLGFVVITMNQTSVSTLNRLRCGK